MATTTTKTPIAIAARRLTMPAISGLSSLEYEHRVPGAAYSPTPPQSIDRERQSRRERQEGGSPPAGKPADMWQEHGAERSRVDPCQSPHVQPTAAEEIQIERAPACPEYRRVAPAYGHVGRGFEQDDPA